MVTFFSNMYCTMCYGENVSVFIRYEPIPGSYSTSYYLGKVQGSGCYVESEEGFTEVPRGSGNTPSLRQISDDNVQIFARFQDIKAYKWYFLGTITLTEM